VVVIVDSVAQSVDEEMNSPEGFEKWAIVPNTSDLIVRSGGSRMDSLGSLNAFVQAAEARSFTVAGRQLGVSSSAIGKAVVLMGERIGVRFVRCTGRWRQRDFRSRCRPRAESARLVDPETRLSADRGHLHRRG
jgi:hypothetical protein